MYVTPGRKYLQLMAMCLLLALLSACGQREADNMSASEPETNSFEPYAESEVSTPEPTGEPEAGITAAIETMPETTSETADNDNRTATDEPHDSEKMYLTDLDISPLYVDFLRNEISVPNPFVSQESDYSELSFFDDRDYDSEFDYAVKSFSLVDVNRDGEPELIFKIWNSPDELMYILGIQEDKLICYDIQETHTSRMSFWIYDNGIVAWSQSHTGAEKIYYTYTDEGNPQELIHFVWEETDPDSDLYYEYYYTDGNESAKCSLQSDEEYESLIAPYVGREPEWYSCDSFADIPRE